MLAAARARSAAGRRDRARALAKRPAERFATTRELQEALLDAGAARRGRQIAPVWLDLQPAAGANETPTLLTSPPIGRANRDGAETQRVRAPESDRGSEPFEDWKRAVDAIDGDIDAAFAPVSSARARASQTAVMDPTQETALLELARPTRMLDDAPFAAHAQSLSAKADQDAGAEGSIGVVWALAAAALIAFAFGTVRLRSAAEDEKEASSRTPVAGAEPSPPRNTAPLPSPPAAAGALRTDAAPKVVAERAPSAPPRRARRDSARKAQAKNAAPAADPGEETGWVIRR